MGRPKQTASKSSSGKAPKKQSAELAYSKFSDGDRKVPKKSAQVYSYCGICIVGLIVYPKSIDDDVLTDCNHVFEENFQMFLRKQKDKNTLPSMQFRMKHEQRMEFATMTKWIGNGNSDSEKYDAHRMAMVGERFCPTQRAPKWADDLLEGFDGAEALVAYLKDLANDSGLLNFDNPSAESCKAVTKDLVISAHHWVVEQLDVALEEFKEFRDGLDEKEREKYDNLVEKQNQKWCDYECESLSFEEVNVIIKEIQKEMDDIIARHNNQNKDIDSLVELIDGKQLGAIPKNKKEKIPKSKKKNRVMKSKSAYQYFENVSDGNISTQKLEEKLEEFTSEGFSIDSEDFKSREASLSDDTMMADELKTTEEKLKNFTSEEFPIYNEDFKSHKASMSDDNKTADELKKTTEALNITKAQLEETKNRLREEQSENFRLNKENDLLKSKLLHNDFKKYRDVLRQRQKNNFGVIDHLRASPELENLPQVQLALRSLHEFSARLLLADQELARQYDILRQQPQTNETIPELHFDLSNVEPSDLGSSCINLLCRSILMNESSNAPFPPPLTSLSSTSSPLGYSSPNSHSRNRPQSPRVAGTNSSAMNSVGSHSSDMPSVGSHSSAMPSVGSHSSAVPSVGSHSSAMPSVGSHSSAMPSVGSHSSAMPSVGSHSSAVPSVGSHSSAVPSVGSQGTSPGFSRSLLPSGSVVSFPSHGHAATSGGTAGATHMNIKPRPDQIRKCASSKLASKITNKKVVSFLEMGGDGASINTEDECSICFEEMRPSDSFYLKLCRHRFHVTCMKRWLVSHRGMSSTCPMCRTYIVKEDEFVNLGAARRS